ncbi:MAG: sporulation integral membrane protein YtvI [Defluviitaleaceae bacterium]|nr:sporulation integral membrane protein YtvI [Defluviitaleaceae bacterium]
MREFYLRHKLFIDRASFFLIITIFVYVFFAHLMRFLGPFFAGLIIALVLEPLVRLIEKKLRWRRWVAAMVSLLFFVVLMSSLGAWIVSAVWNQAVGFVGSVPVHVEEFVYRLDDANAWLGRWEEHLPEAWDIPDIQEMILTAVTTLFGDGVLDQGRRFVAGTPNFLINVLVAIISAYFIMADRKNIFAFLKNAVPRWLMAQMTQTKKGLVRALGGYFRAQYILMIMSGIISIIGLLILRNPYALLIGLLLAVLDFMPVVGIGAVLWPWAFVSVVMGDIRQAVGLMVIYGIITIARQVMQPKILGAQMGAHPLASLMSIYVGFRIFGLLGLIIGPALMMIFIAIREANVDI